ncbi:MAG: DUF3500 domain-containing protein [Pirellulales bacterium]
MQRQRIACPDCDALPNGHSIADGVNRRVFLKVAGATALAAGGLPSIASAAAGAGKPESVVKVLYESLSEEQRGKICFAWDHQHPQNGLLRTRVANNWHITEPDIGSSFYTADQQAMIRDIFEGIIQPDWHQRIDKQLEDDAGGYGVHQNIAIFGSPGEGKFEFVMTGRHMTLRCDGNSADHVAFGGPIFYGHAASGFDEPADHDGNVFWPQAVEANKLFEMLDGRQRELALVEKLPREQHVTFRGTAGGFPGIPVSEMSSDQREHAQKVLQKLIEPYRQEDQDEVVACLKAQGGLDKCALAFYKEGDIGGDGVWDCWRLEGPAFVWYFRGSPHVHVWVNVASDPSVTTNT